MKKDTKTKTLRILIVLLSVTLICLVAFLGVNHEEKGQMKNILPKFNLGMDLNGYRSIYFKVSDSTKASKDTTTEETTTEKTATEEPTTEELVNKPEDLTTENYDLSKAIMEKRIKDFGISEYYIRENKSTGAITIELAENTNTDDLVEILQSQGRFEIKDTETKEVLLDNSDVKDFNVGYANQENGIVVYLSIQFNKQGTEKYKNITSTYVKKETNTEATDDATAQAEELATAQVAEEQNIETQNAEEKEKTVTLYMDDTEILSTGFEKVIETGVLQLTVGSQSKDQGEIKDSIANANKIAARFNSGCSPLVYKVDQNKFMQSDITEETIRTIIAFTITIFVSLICYYVAEYKEKGLNAGIALMLFVALLTLLVKYTNAVLTIEGLVAFGLILLLEYEYLLQILKLDKYNKANTDKVLRNIIIKSVGLSIIAIIGIFSKWVPFQSFGTIGFWGIALAIALNYLVLKEARKESE